MLELSKQTAILCLMALSLMVMIPTGAEAQEQKQTLVAKAVKAATNFLDEWAADGIDTNYVALPEKGGTAQLTLTSAGINTQVKSPLISGTGHAKMDLASSLNGQTTVFLGYRGIGFSYSYDLINGYSKDFSFDLSSNAFGVSYRAHATKGMSGTLKSDALASEYKIKENDTEVNSTILYGYYIFNSDRFSLSAATDQIYIQRHSAGSPIVMALYHFTKLQNLSDDVITNLHGVEEIQMSQGAIGAGYAYNYSINQGQVLLHAMAIPMLIFHNNNWITLQYPMGESVVPISQKMIPKHKYSLTEWVQASVTWNINKHCYLNAMGTFNSLSHKVSGYNIKINVNDWLATTSFGYRF